MEYRSLGKTGLNVSVIGIGVEHLKYHPEENIAGIIREAIRKGVNYFDLVWSLPNVIQGVAEGIADKRKNTYLAVHLGSCYKDGKYLRSTTPGRCEEVFIETLKRLGTNYADLINLHYVKDIKQWNIITKPKGVLDLAVRLRDDGWGNRIAISTHDIHVVKLAAEHPEIESVMYQINMANHNLKGRDEALQFCIERGMGIVAMKPYAGGKLLQTNKTVNIATYQTGGLSLKRKIPGSITPVKCLSYTLSQSGVSCAVTGVKNIEELHGGLAYLDASEIDRDFQQELKDLF